MNASVVADGDFESLRHSRMAISCIAGKSLDLSRISKGRVALVGAGTTGSNVGLALAAVGVSVDVWDTDQVGPETLGRSIAYTSTDVGKLKSRALAAHMMALNPGIRARGFVEDALLSVGGARWEGYDVLILATDNLRSRVELSALALRLPWGPVAIEAGLAGFDWSVQTMGRGTACYGCALPDDFDDARQSCNGIAYDASGTVLPTTLPAALSASGMILTDTLLALSGHEPLLLGREIRARLGARSVALLDVPPRPSCRRHARLAEGEVLRLEWGPDLRVGEIRAAVAQELKVESELVALTAPRAVMSKPQCLDCGRLVSSRPAYLALFTIRLCDCGALVANTKGCECGREAPAPPARPYRRLECHKCGNLDPGHFDFESSTQLRTDLLTTRAAGLPDEEILEAWADDRSLTVLLQSSWTTSGRVAATSDGRAPNGW